MARGGKQPGSGRPKGSRNKSTADVKEAARMYGQAAIEKLVQIMEVRDDSPAAQISAAKEILDRAYGKATQPIGNEDDKPFLIQMIERRIVHPDNRHR